MLRIFKTYKFNLNNPLVKAYSLKFSSRPGDIISKDDFWATSAKLVVMETSLLDYNATIFSS